MDLSPSALDSQSAESSLAHAPPDPRLAPPGDEAAALAQVDPALAQASQPFVGQWNRLVSTTNWQKGRIVLDWRAALVAEGVPVTQYSDETWSRLVGGVTGQHVGRLRRVSQRFGQVHEQYRGLFWSHFQAAIDWNDAEMWLEGAVQNGWSVGQMRDERWRTLGAVEADAPRAEDVPASETDEDFEPVRSESTLATTIAGEYGQVQAGPRLDGPDFGDDDAPANERTGNAYEDQERVANPVELVRPFENLPELPDDLAEAFDAMKLAILRHKTAGFEAIAAADILHSLDALKALVTAPSSDGAPF